MIPVIPKTYELMGRQWTNKAVTPEEYLATIESSPIPDDSEAQWHADSGCCSLVFATNWVVPKKWGSPEFTTLSYFHELAHSLCFSMGRVEDGDHFTEREIELLGQLLYQYETSKKGEVKV